MIVNKTNFKFIYLEITKNCNLMCPFCPSNTVKKDEYVSTEQFMEMINKIKNYTKCVYLHVLGEPLLHPHLIDLIKICNQNNLMVRLTTNGTLLYKYDFSNINVNKINISLQSLINLSEQAQRNYLLHLKTFFNQIEEKLICGSLGVELRLWNDKSNEEVKKLNKKILKNLTEIINYKKYPNVRIDEEEEFEWPSEKNSVNDDFFYCHGGKTHLAILVNGDVVLCCLDYLAKTKIGNIYQQNLKEILSGDLYQNALNTKKPFFELCKKCKYRSRFIKTKVR